MPPLAYAKTGIFPLWKYEPSPGAFLMMYLCDTGENRRPMYAFHPYLVIFPLQCYNQALKL